MVMTADARVETEKSSRYLQALCGHFSRKVKAEYSSEHGRVDFGFGVCTLRAETDALLLHVEADNAETCGRVKDVVGGHLERFAAMDELTVIWTDAQLTNA
jgi:hypothetical protein